MGAKSPGLVIVFFSLRELASTPLSTRGKGVFKTEMTRDLDVVSLYVREAQRHRRLTCPEERQLSAMLRAATAVAKPQSGPATATVEASRRRLVEGNLRLVVRIAHHYKHLGLPLDDLIQEGNLGLIAAARTFDPARIRCFSAHAERWIRTDICRALSQKSRTIRIPLNQLGLRRLALSVESELEQQYRNEECVTGEHHVHTTEDDARFIGVDAEALRSTILHVPVVGSLDAPGAGDLPPLADTIADTRSESPCDAAARSEEYRQLRDGIGHLPPRLQYVLERRYGLQGVGSASLAEIGEELHLSAERVRQLQNRALELLRRNLSRGASRHYDLNKTTRRAFVRSRRPRGPR
ncbi:MAG: sigma-70 family RNA polymerase sigma factor [Acidobacteriota bacterium]|nr:sigma-70 family RNA polymerase sigma factor [Acidobacteriota bacterium]